MSQIQLSSVVGPDGVLHLNVPLGVPQANRKVRVLIDSEDELRVDAEYQDWLQQIRGAWQGDFERPDQGPLEERLPL